MDTRRDFIYVDDLIDVVMLALDGKGRGKYHVSSGSDFSIKELFDATTKALDIQLDEDVEVRPRRRGRRLHDPARPLAHPRGLRRLEHPAPRWSEGVAHAIEYYRERGIEQTYTHLKVPSQ